MRWHEAARGGHPSPSSGATKHFTGFSIFLSAYFLLAFGFIILVHDAYRIECVYLCNHIWQCSAYQAREDADLPKIPSSCLPSALDALARHASHDAEVMAGSAALARDPLDKNPLQEECHDGGVPRCKSLASMIQDLRDVDKVPKRCGKCHHLKFLGDWAAHHNCTSSTCRVPAVVDDTQVADSESNLGNTQSTTDRCLPDSHDCGCSTCQELIKLHWQHQVAEKVSRAPRKCKTCGHHPHLGRWLDLHPKKSPCMVAASDHSKAGKGGGWKELCCPCNECQLHLQQPM